MTSLQYIEVTLKLPLDVYRTVEHKATALGIGAGRLLTAFVCKSVHPSSEHDSAIVMKLVEPRRVGYDALPLSEQAEFRRLATSGATGLQLAKRFHVSASTALGWRKKLVDQGKITVAASPRLQPASDEVRSYVRLRDEDRPELVRMFARNATKQEVADRFGISLSSVSNWRKRLADEVRAQVAIIESGSWDVNQCQWCGAPAQGVAFQTDEHTYPAPSCGEHGYDYAAYQRTAERSSESAAA